MKRFAAIAAVLAFSGVAQADTPPSVWQRAAEPSVGDDFAIHEQAMARLYAVDRDSDGTFFSAPIAANNEAQIRGVISMLTAAGADTSKRPLLRFDLALAYEMYGERSKVFSAFQRAAVLYKSALAEFPSYEGADEAWSALGSACAHIADRDCEMKSWHQVLRRRTEDAARIVPTLNLAEAEMHEGELKSAIEGYRDTFAIAARLPNAIEEGVEAEYGLAVALDRAGEINEAAHEAKLGFDMAKGLQNPNVLHGEGVYFVPAYEINWYDGLIAAAVARAELDPKRRLDDWRVAVEAFEVYIKVGEVAKDRWLPIAKARLALYVAERDKAEKQAKNAPPPHVDPPAGPAPQVHNPGTTVIHL